MKEQTKENLAKGLDIFEPPRFMSVTEAIKQLLEVEDARGEGVCTRDKWAIGLARVGQETQQYVTENDLLVMFSVFAVSTLPFP